MATHIKPSELVDLIDQEIPAVKEEDESNRPKNFEIGPEVQGALLRMVADVIDSLFESQLPRDRQHMFQLMLGANEIRHCLDGWSRSLSAPAHVLKPRLKGSPRTNNLNPLTLVRRALTKTFDQPKPDWVDKLAFVTDEGLRKDLQLDITSTKSLLEASEWKATIILSGSATETLLLDTHRAMHAKVKRLIANKNLTTKSNKKISAEKIDNWNLEEHLVVSKELGILRPTTIDMCSALRQYRNLVHPGKVIREDQRPSRALAQGAHAALLIVIEDLSRHFEKQNKS